MRPAASRQPEPPARTKTPVRVSTVKVHVGTQSFVAVFNGTPIAHAILSQLPITSTVNRWGDEIYFDVPVKLANTQPTREVSIGGIAYWPEGPSLCIFFGKTPASKGDEPRPASDVTVVGHTDAPVDLLRSITEGMPITLDMS